MNQKLDLHKGHIDIYIKTNESKLMIHYLYMHTLIPIELLPYLQCVAITETKGSLVVRDSSVVRRHYISLLEPSNVRAQYIRKTADLLLQLWVSTFPRFVAIGFYFLSETLI